MYAGAGSAAATDSDSAAGCVGALRDGRDETFQPEASLGGDGHNTQSVFRLVGLHRVAVEQIELIEDYQTRDLVGANLHESAFHFRRLVPAGGAGVVENMQETISVGDLAQRGAECGEERSRQFV